MDAFIGSCQPVSSPPPRNHHRILHREQVPQADEALRQLLYLTLWQIQIFPSRSSWAVSQILVPIGAFIVKSPLIMV